MEHTFYLDAHWDGGRNSTGTIAAGNLKQSISIPKEMDGPGVGTNPDEMLLGAAATCFLITYAAILERAAIKTDALALASEAIVDVTNNVFTFKKIHHRPTVTVFDASQIKKAEQLAFKAEQSCMISKAVAGNVQITVEPTVQSGASVE
ncbi:YmaD protein [Bacillus sp. JCM 19046]|nr:YmaD protein [Bacillus sp. JCM 19045]GAF19974.1 YmaD protein [Bacillus sp. JCM 19046]